MKLLFAFITSFVFFLQTSDIENIRKFYPTAGQSAQNAEKFASLVEKTTEKNAVINGYKAASQIILAKFEKGKNKISLTRTGIKALESAVNSDPNESELRMIRLSIQENLPGIVGYKSNIKEDKNFIINNLPKQSTVLKTYIKGFISTSKSFTDNEKAALK